MNGIIARQVHAEGFAGREHRGQAVPSQLGKTLWRLYRTQFNSSLEHLLKALIDDHPAGWSNLVQGPQQCLCHGKSPERSGLFTETSRSDHQWCYRFGRTPLGQSYMDVLYRPSRASTWHCVGSRLRLDDEREPQWFSLEALASFCAAALEASVTRKGAPEATMPTATLVHAAPLDIEQAAKDIEARAAARGPRARVSFLTRYGFLTEVHPDGPSNRWLLSNLLPWGVYSAPVPSRLDGIRFVLRDGGQEQPVDEGG